MPVPLVTGPYLAAVVLLGLAGAVKVARPGDTAEALRVAGLPTGRRLVRVGALGEMVVAAVALAGRGSAGTVGAVLVAAAYLGFAVFIVVAMAKRWPLSSCGCFARPDTRPTVAHVVLDAAGAVAAIGWAMARPSSVAVVWRGPAGTVGALLVASAAVAILAYLVFTIPELGGRGTSEPGRGFPELGGRGAGSTDAGSTGAGTTDAGSTGARTTDAGSTGARSTGARSTGAGSGPFRRR